MNFIEIMKSPTLSLNDKELKIQLGGTFILSSLLIIFLSLFISSIAIELSFLSIFIFLEMIIIFLLIPFIFLEKIKKHFNFLDSTGLGLSFEGLIILFSFIGMGILIGFLLMGLLINNFYTCMGIGLSFCYPAIIMFLRRAIFSEDSQYIGNSIVLGYEPKNYLFLSLICGYPTIGFGLNILSRIGTGTFEYITIIFYISICMFWIFLILSPNYWNKYLPFEIKKRSGFFIYSIIAIAISLLIPLFFRALL